MELTINSKFNIGDKLYVTNGVNSFEIIELTYFEYSRNTLYWGYRLKRDSTNLNVALPDNLIDSNRPLGSKFYYSNIEDVLKALMLNK